MHLNAREYGHITVRLFFGGGVGHATFIVGDSRAHLHIFLYANDSVQVTVVFTGHKKQTNLHITA